MKAIINVSLVCQLLSFSAASALDIFKDQKGPLFDAILNISKEGVDQEGVDKDVPQKRTKELFDLIVKNHKKIDSDLVETVERLNKLSIHSATMSNKNFKPAVQAAGKEKMALLEKFAKNEMNLELFLDLYDAHEKALYKPQDYIDNSSLRTPEHQTSTFALPLSIYTPLIAEYATNGKKTVQEKKDLYDVFSTLSRCTNDYKESVKIITYPDKEDSPKEILKKVMDAFTQKKFCLEDFKKYYPAMCSQDYDIFIGDNNNCRQGKNKELFDFLDRLIPMKACQNWIKDAPYFKQFIANLKDQNALDMFFEVAPSMYFSSCPKLEDMKDKALNEVAVKANSSNRKIQTKEKTDNAPAKVAPVPDSKK